MNRSKSSLAALIQRTGLSAQELVNHLLEFHYS
jgi:hypothetical protein